MTLNSYPIQNAKPWWQILKNMLLQNNRIQTAEEIDQTNILIATKQAMISALDQLHPAPDYVLVDAVHLNDYKKAPQEAIIKGDATVYAIAAASIYAKEYRIN